MTCPLCLDAERIEMELRLPEQFALDETSLAMIRDVESAARKVWQFRPLPPAVLKRIEDALFEERVHNSNAIEGNTLEFRETALILKQGIEGFKKKREALEARNLGEAIKKIAELVPLGQTAHTCETLLAVHAVVLRDIDDAWAGRLRTQQVMIQGAKHQPPDASVVAPLLERIMGRLVGPVDGNPLTLAVWAHWALARVHPFLDGNGRMARLWQDMLLFQGNLTCPIIRLEDRRSYLDALQQADDGDLNPMIQFVAGRLNNTFDKYIAAIRLDEDDKKWAETVAGEVDEQLKQVEQTRRLSYTRWARKMEQVRWEFGLCASRISEVSRAIQIQVQPQSENMIDQTAWQNLRAGLSVPWRRFFVVDFARGREHNRFLFFFSGHSWSDLDTDEDQIENSVGLQVFEETSRGAVTAFDQLDSAPSSIREILVVNDQLVVRRHDPVTHRDRYDRDLDAAALARLFIQDIVQNRLNS